MTGRQRTFIIVSLLVAIFALPTKADYRQDSRAIRISGGEKHTLVVTANKWAWTCGPNGGHEPAGTYYGVLGTGSISWSLTENSPVQVHGANDVNYLEDISDIDAGWKHSLALDVNGFVWSWGWNSWGQLGIGNVYEKTAPVQVFRGEQADDPCQASDYLMHIIGISAGRSGEHSLAVDANGYAYAWGRNTHGQCGNGGGADSELTPVRILAGEQDASDPNSPFEQIIAVSAGEWHSMGLERDDPNDANFNGCVYTWGDDSYGPDGDGRGVLGTGRDG